MAQPDGTFSHKEIFRASGLRRGHSSCLPSFFRLTLQRLANRISGIAFPCPNNLICCRVKRQLALIMAAINAWDGKCNFTAKKLLNEIRTKFQTDLCEDPRAPEGLHASRTTGKNVVRGMHLRGKKNCPLAFWPIRPLRRARFLLASTKSCNPYKMESANT